MPITIGLSVGHFISHLIGGEMNFSRVKLENLGCIYVDFQLHHDEIK